MLAAHAEGRLLALRTSGSTGSPRTVVRSAASWLASFPYVAQRTALLPGSRVWLPGPLGSTMNLYAATLAAWAGAGLTGDPASATHAHLTPAALSLALDALPPGAQVTVAGDRLDRAAHDRAAARGLRVSHYYGAAELSFVAWGAHAEDLRPFPGVEVDLRDGEIWVRSTGVCEAVLGGAGALRRGGDGFATVGDRGRWDGDRLLVTGRGGAAVTTGGLTVLVADVEEALRGAAQGAVVVVPAPHDVLGQVVAGVLTDERDLEAVRAAARGGLEPGQRPRVWLLCRDLPLTGAGKVDRVRLAEEVAGRGLPRLVPGRAVGRA